MARSIDYKRSLDVKVSPKSGNSNHGFQFVEFVGIKEEDDNELLDMESGPTLDATVTNSSGLHDDHKPELHSLNTSEQMHGNNDAAHRKLVIKFHDLWTKSEQSVDFYRKRKSSEDRKLKNEILTEHEQSSNETSGLSILSDDCITPSSSSTSRPSNSNQEKKITSIYFQWQSASTEERRRDVGNFGQLKSDVNTSCEYCGLHFETSRKLRAHIRYYDRGGEFHCTICGEKFNLSFQLARHMKVIHSDTPAMMDNYRFQCHYCVDRFEKRSSLIRHTVHLHHKHVVLNRKSTNGSRETVFSPDLGARRKKTKRCMRKSKHIRNLNFGKTTLDGDSSGSGGNLCYINEHLIDEASRLQQNNPTGSQFTGDNVDFKTAKANIKLNQNLRNTSHSKLRTLLERINIERTMTLQQIQYSINDSTAKSTKPRDVQGTIDNAAFRSNGELSLMNTDAPILQESNEERSQTQRWSQTGIEILPEDAQSPEMENLVDHLGNIVGTLYASRSYDQPDEQDHVSSSNSASTTAGLGIADLLRSTRNSIFKPTTFRHIPNIMATIPRSGYKSTQDEDSFRQKRRMNATENNNGMNARLKVLPQHRESDKQVVSVQSHQALENLKNARRNVAAEDAAIERNDSHIDSIQIDDFGGISVKIEDEEKNGDSCEPISLEMTASSSNISFKDSLSPKFDDVTTLKSCNTRKYPKMKDLRVLLVRLEDTLNLPMKYEPPKSSLFDNYSLVRTATPHCDSWKEQSTSNLVSRNSRSIISKNRDTTSNIRQVISKKNGPRGLRKSGEGKVKATIKRCHLCDEVFQNIFLSATHYLLVHTAVGMYVCCVCNKRCKNLGKLRIHLLGHFSETPRKNLCKSCVVCEEEFSISSSSERCPNCNENSNAKRDREERRKQTPNVKDSIKHSHTQFSEKVDASENRLSEISSVSMSKIKVEINTPVVDHESAKNDKKFLSSVSCKEVVKNFNCSACNCAFFNSRQLRHHLLVAHTDVKYRKTERYQNVFKPQTLSYSTTRDSERGRRKRSKNKNNVTKFNLGKKKYLESKGTRIHDKFCKKKSYERGRLKFFKINSRSQHLIRHNIRDDAETCYEHNCDVCGLKCCCRRNLEIHKKRYSANEKNSCNICGITFASKRVLAMHMNIAHCQKDLFRSRIRCEICNQGFHNKKFLRIHLAHSHNLKYFQCTICRIRFNTSRRLNNHRRYYSKNRDSLCNICGQLLECKYMLQYHKAQVHDREKLKAYKYLCKLCNCAFIDKLLLQAHIGHFHNKEDCEAEANAIDEDVIILTEQVSENIELPVRTDIICNDSNVPTNISVIQKNVIEADRDQRTSEDVEVVGEIIRTHAIDEDVIILTEQVSKNIKLPVRTDIICNDSNVPRNISVIQKNVIEADRDQKTSEDAVVVGDIIRTHTLNRYKCDICKLSFSDPYAMLNHEWDYSNEGIFTCNVCNRNFMTYFLLKNHKIKHFQQNVIRNYECYICKEDFSRADQLNIHGLHLHGPQFMLAKGSATADILQRNMSESAINSECDSVSKKFPVDDGYELVAGYHKTCQVGKILLFRKIGNDKSSTELLQRNSNEDAYRCCFCQTSFNSSILLRNHIKEHDYRAYYNHSSKYLCLICKDKFRTNDILRAHVVYCHTSDPEEQDLTESKKSQTQSNNIRSAVNKNDNTTDTVAKNSPTKHTIQNLVSSSTIVKSDYPEIILHIALDSPPEEVKLFTVKVEDVEGLQKTMCTVCIVTFDSVEKFIEHFTSTHVKDGAYLCTFCGEQFPLMVDLKKHTSKHEYESKKYVCCDEKVLLVTDFDHHQSSHERQTEEEDTPNIQLSPLVESDDGSLEEFDNESNADQTVNPCKCEICGKTLINFETMLKHWDSCIDINGLECDLCNTTFRSLTSFREHRTTYHKGMSDSNIIKNRRKPGVTSNQTIEASVMHGNNFRTIDQSIIVYAGKKPERAVTLTNELPKEEKLLKFENITAKPLAKEVKDLKNNDDCYIVEHQENNATGPRPEFTPNRDVRLPELGSKPKAVSEIISGENFVSEIHWEIKDNFTTSVSTSPQPVNSSTQDCQADREVSNDIDENSSLYHLPVQGGNNIRRVYVGPNNSRLKLQQNECREKKLASSQPIYSSTVNDLSSIPTTAHRSIDIINTRVASSESDENRRLNDREIQEPSNFIPASFNAANNAPYLLCIQPTANHSDNMNNAVVSPSDFGQTVQPNDSSSTLPPSLLPFPLNVGPSPAYFLCVKPISDNPPEAVTQAAPLNGSMLMSQPNNYIARKLRMLLEKSPNFVPNPIHGSSGSRKANKSNRKNKRNVVPYDFTSRRRSTSNKAMRAPRFPSAPRPSTSRNPAKSKAKVTTGSNIPTNQRTSKTELEPRKLNVQCGYCNLRFTDKAEFIQHLESHNTNNQCRVCGLTFSNEKGLRLHLPEHKSSTCSECNMIAFFSDSLALDTDEAKYCSACNTLLPEPKRMRGRLTNSSPHRVMKCGICMETFDTMSQMTVHFRKFHSVFVCGTCDAGFSRRVSLHQHMQTHGSGNPDSFQCKTCEKYFLNEMNLAEHSLSH